MVLQKLPIFCLAVTCASPVYHRWLYWRHPVSFKSSPYNAQLNMEAKPIFTYIYVFLITRKSLFQCSGDAKWCKSKQLICGFEIFAIFSVSLLFLALTACKLSLIFDVFYFFIFDKRARNTTRTSWFHFWSDVDFVNMSAGGVLLFEVKKLWVLTQRGLNLFDHSRVPCFYFSKILKRTGFEES